MAQINVTNLTFAYEGSFDYIFENVSFSIDTNWKLGFIGRNGKGKTTFLNLLLGRYDYEGSISTNVVFDYFPYKVSCSDLEKTADELMEKWKPSVESWRVMCELPKLSIDAELLYRPFKTLSFGERTKVMLAVLFSGENDFLLIDEPTNHLDMEAREIIKNYLASKKGFILVSHDRDLLDACIDHVLVLNRATIEVQAGNFSSWWENKSRADAFSKHENEKHLKEIGKLKAAADRSSRWADKSESTKIGFDPIKETDRSISSRSYIGGKTKKMQSRVKSYEKRMDREIAEKEGLLQDIEEPIDLKVMSMEHYKKVLVDCKDLTLRYCDGAEPVVKDLSFDLLRGERVFLSGENGSGKSTLIKAILAAGGQGDISNLSIEGTLNMAPNLVISYINQDTSWLKGSLKDYALMHGLDYSLFLSILSQLDMSRVQFEKNIEDYSEGQKKKVLIAGSLLTSAHLYIWDEPLNYIDVFSRMQIEKLIEEYQPTMLLVEHDVRFREKLATKEIMF
ncbi:lincosamide and streptogramin A transport system ATP-binding/permease protein [Pseudobutyrivibrio sp. YE44]|uniref:ribosomal protection-like ABC-F family protein n=1 Tax=Pseudobutyrivibrio sp. YE44 TaxID=1520802 RepID=UPI0008841116|nr:ATP-binding cassette domain-containing protein [Pseudobutyrivibrio sp. YE44]SDB22464.1 lincosamide and streptogramin A transport system ATP-binding/permease protein [Pseudobutyrivibrio sp. YE44]